MKSRVEADTVSAKNLIRTQVVPRYLAHVENEFTGKGRDGSDLGVFGFVALVRSGDARAHNVCNGIPVKCRRVLLHSSIAVYVYIGRVVISSLHGNESSIGRDLDFALTVVAQ